MEEVCLEEVLAHREKRVRRRQELLAQYPFPVACLGLNIPGRRKTFPWARRCFHEEIEAFTLALQAEGIAVIHQEAREEKAGYTAHISARASPDALKAIAERVEETHLLGRLFDIDIHEPGGKKLSRDDKNAPPRRCFVCGESGFACARSLSHPPEHLWNSVLRIMENWLRQKLGDGVCSAALWAMMSEAAVTPKPGLVDRANSGAHRDMDFFTFIDSASALLPWFRSCALAGFDSGGAAALFPEPRSLFESLRPPGRIAELAMKNATGGVNVHRGYIFSLGVLCAAYGRMFRDTAKPDVPGVLEFSKKMTVALEEDFARPAGNRSHGEEVYAQTGIRGIRGEVLRGFPTVTEHALPLLRRMLKQGYSLNDAGAAVLLKILAHAQDTNIIHRGGRRALGEIQSDLAAFFAEDQAALPSAGAIQEKAACLDREFTSRNLSPGGSADLLGVTFFLLRLEAESGSG
ncbi:MAG: citrate lyase holo-[acyl-carrier protein] synthase [Treponema sp.]|nr:citrate lyase holo-[acyl-carrier protein] synthase [Treponema sp.]